MNSHVSEELLALFLSGDLADKQYVYVTRHVTICPECRTTLADLSKSHQILMASLEDPEQDELAAVRLAILRGIRTRTTRSGRWIWSLGSLAAALTIALVLARRGERQELPPITRLPRPAPPLAFAVLSPPPQPPTAHFAQARRKHIEPGMRGATLITEANRPAILKMNTSDPNVVILWQLQDNEKVTTP